MKIKTLLLSLLVLLAPATARDLQIGKQTIVRQQPGLDVSVAYPVIDGLPAEFNRQARSRAEQMVAEFLEHYQDIKADLRADLTLTLQVDFAVAHQSDQLLSLLFSGDEYSGGAHGNPVYYMLHVDPASGRKLSVEDLFRSRQGLSVLARVCRQELLKKEGLAQNPDWVLRGTLPTTDNLTLTWAEQDGVHVIFPPYQVAPYVAGTSEVTVAYIALSGLLSERLDPGARLPGQWRVVTIDGQPVGGTIELTFDDNGFLTGTTGVNQLSGSYQTAGHFMTIPPLVTTKMAGSPEAMKAEAALLTALGNVTGFAFEGQRLLLKDQQQTVIELTP
ncbi:MAG: META domain-containing protein [Vulcanimicrobiota bacterium]